MGELVANGTLAVIALAFAWLGQTPVLLIAAFVLVIAMLVRGGPRDE